MKIISREAYKRMTTLLERIYRKYWLIICGGPTLILLCYQLYKSRMSWHFAANVGRPTVIHLDAFIMILAGCFCALAAVIFHKQARQWLVVLITGSTILSSAGVWMQKDRNNEWIGADVPTYNHQAALLALDIGPLSLINTWNARGNPYADSNELPHPEEIIARIEKNRLGWLVGSRWQIKNLPQENNRMHQHPPGYPLVLASWMAIFGRGHLAVQIFEFFLKLCLVLLAFAWTRKYFSKTQTLNHIAATLLLASAPPVILFYEPHANELAALFAAIALMAVGNHVKNRFSVLINASVGIMLALAAYTNFFYMLLLIVFMVVLAFSREAWKDWVFPWVLAGSALVVLLFGCLGYYPWLTYITGNQVIHYYRLSHPFDVLSSVLDFLYFGFPLLLIGLLLFFEVHRISDRILKYCMIGVLIALLLGAYQSFALAAISRYLIGIFFLLLPLICTTMVKLDFDRLQVATIPIANFLFLIIVLFL